jgi:hypothetical protein
MSQILPGIRDTQGAISGVSRLRRNEYPDEHEDDCVGGAGRTSRARPLGRPHAPDAEAMLVEHLIGGEIGRILDLRTLEGLGEASRAAALAKRTASATPP